MLEKIVNINAGSDYKNSTKPSKYSVAGRYLTDYQTHSNDSVTISPASSFIAKIHWRLKQVKKDVNKVEIIFDFDNFEFHTIISPSELIQSPHFNYHIKKNLEGLMTKGELNLTVSSAVDNISHEFEIKDKLSILNSFVEETLMISGDKYLLNESDYSVNTIFYALVNGLKPEFEYLNNCLIIFFEKLMSTKITVPNNTAVHGNTLVLKNYVIKNI
ncbi:MAG: hypothetical protein KF816_01760 [Melioribacteraceae bacterium]|jgi:hypothetical protein|nr:hypothetical protein [Melioribacteraceae bacterium]